MDAEQGASQVERAARNETLFRNINERLEELASTFQEVAGTTMFACECADLSCIEQIEVKLEEYEAVRSVPNQFLVLHRHVDPDIEYVVREDEGFVVVAKIGEGAAIAAKADPRASTPPS